MLELSCIENIFISSPYNSQPHNIEALDDNLTNFPCIGTSSYMYSRLKCISQRALAWKGINALLIVVVARGVEALCGLSYQDQSEACQQAGNNKQTNKESNEETTNRLSRDC